MIRRFPGNAFIEAHVAGSETRKNLTYVALVKLADVSSAGLMSYKTITHEDPGAFAFLVNSEELRLHREGLETFGLSTTGLEDVWCLLAATKEEGGANTKFHLFRFDTEEWFHGESFFPLSNGPLNTNGFIYFGYPLYSGWLNGDYAAAAVYKRVLSQAEIEALVTVEFLEEWKATSPNALWFFNQEEGEPLLDLTGGGADEVSKENTEFIADFPPIPYVEGEELPTPGAPEAELSGSVGVSGTEVKLHGHVLANGSATDYFIEYGTEPGVFTDNFPVSEDGNGGAKFSHKPITVTIPKGTLAPSTLYYARLVAISELGEDETTEIEFTTEVDSEEPEGATVGVLVGGELVTAKRSVLVGGELIPA